MGLYAWSARCIPGFSILVLLALTLLALTDAELSFHASWHDAIYDTGRRPSKTRIPTPIAEITYPQITFAVYNVFIHFLSFLFPLRLCWSLWQITCQVQDLNSQHMTTLGNQTTEDTKTRTVGSVGGSLSPIDTSGHNHQDWPQRPKSSSGMVYHAIIVPIYREDIDTLRDTLDVLASHAQARTSYDVSNYANSISQHELIFPADFSSNGREGSLCRKPSWRSHSSLLSAISSHHVVFAPFRPFG